MIEKNPYAAPRRSQKQALVGLPGICAGAGRSRAGGLSLRGDRGAGRCQPCGAATPFRRGAGIEDGDRRRGLFRRHAAFMRAGPAPRCRSPSPALRRDAGAMCVSATTHPHLFTLMFSTRDAEFSDPDLPNKAGAESYGVLADIAEGAGAAPMTAHPDGKACARKSCSAAIVGHALAAQLAP